MRIKSNINMDKMNMTLNNSKSLLIIIGLLISELLECNARGIMDRTVNSGSPPLVSLPGMFSNGNSGKNPLVAATYYFNPSSSSISGRRPETVFVGSESNINENVVIPSADVCKAPDGRSGTCYDASECVNRGGMPMGKCDSSVNGVNTPIGAVCCLFEVTCGESATERYIYFRSPNFPEHYDRARMCRTKIGKIERNVCQFKIDFLTFDIAKPVEGNCSQDIFVISGQNENHIVPKICGLNSGQHYFIGVDESGVVSFHLMMLGSYQRRFDILITQIPCHADNSAPPHCLQYYTGTHGTIKSFNYDYDQEDPLFDTQEGYVNDVDYMMCIRKESGFCSITYELSSDAEGTLPFAIGSGPDNNQGQLLPVIAECRDDYIVIGGMRLCSGNAKLVGSDNVSGDSGDNALLRLTGRQGNTLGNVTSAHRTVITDATPGPFMIRFFSNNAKNARGFHIGYRQNPCK